MIGARKAPRREGGHEEVLPGPVAGGGQHLEPHREDDDEHDAEPEERHRLARHRDHRAQVVHQRVPLERGQDAQGQGDQERHAQAGEGEVERRRHALDHELEGGSVGVPGLAEVALHRAARELPVLHVDRLVEPEQLVVARVLLLARVLGQEQGDRVADDVQDREGQHGDPDDDDRELDELAESVALHDGQSGADRRRPDGVRRIGAPKTLGLLLPRRHDEHPVHSRRRGASYSTRFEMPHTPRSPHL